jgi:hypothetical protein
MSYDAPTSDDRPIWDTWLSIHYLPAVTVADELGLLKSLNDSPAAAPELADRLGFDRRATVAILRMLKSLGFLSLNEGLYRLTDPARLYLLRDSPFYWGHMLGTGQPQHARWRDLLQNGSPRGVPGTRAPRPSRKGPARWGRGPAGNSTWSGRGG